MFGLFGSTTIPALEQSIQFSQRRHQLLASNVANLDTPGYRTRDLDTDEFQAALADSIRYPEGRPDASHAVSPSVRDDRFAGPRDATEQVVYHDDSDVSLEHQVTQIAKNQSLHSMAITTMRSQFALLQAAITERA